MSLSPAEELFVRSAKLALSGEEREEIAARAAVPGDAEIVRVLELARDHGCTLVVGHNLLRTGLSGGLARQVSARLLARAARNRLLFTETRRIAAALERDHVRAVVWKGLTLNRTLYPSIELRESEDIDLLCTPAEAEKAGDSLVRRGYRFLHHRAGESGFLRHENGQRLSVEIHTDVPFFPRAFLSRLLADTVVREIDGERIRCLEDTADFLALVSYVTVHTPPRCLRYLNDFDGMIRLRDIQWPRVFAEKWLGMGVYLILYLLRELFGREIPVPGELDPGPWRRRVIGDLFSSERILRPKTWQARLRRYLLFRSSCPHAEWYLAHDAWGTLREILGRLPISPRPGAA